MPWAPYGVAFSHDGRTLATGGGSWYGGGGIQLDTIGGASTVTPSSLLPIGVRAVDIGPTISNVCWSADDRHLAASTWRSSQRNGTALIYARTAGDLPLEYLRQAHASSTFPATGVLFDNGDVMLRHHRCHPHAMLARHRLPDELGIARANPASHLASHRVVIVGDHVITGDHGLADAPATAQLVVAQRAVPIPKLVVVRFMRRITALTVRRDGTIVVGGADGEIDAVAIDGSSLGRMRERTRHAAANRTGPTYTVDAITAMCTLPDERVVAVGAGGEVTIDGGSPLQLEIAGTVRSVAAHPDGHVIAVGFKQGGFATPTSAVAIVSLEEPLPAITPRLVAMARECDASRLDRDSLDVLADALEEHDASPAILAHLRVHHVTSRDCWIVERLLGRLPSWLMS